MLRRGAGPKIEPALDSIQDVSVSGNRAHRPGMEVHLFMALTDIPQGLGWKMIWKVNGAVVRSQIVPDNPSGSLITFEQFVPEKEGEYLYEGCLSAGETEVCRTVVFLVEVYLPESENQACL